MMIRISIFACGWLCLAPGLAPSLRAADPKADPKIEIASRGAPESAVFIRRSALDKIKLPQPRKINDKLTVTHATTGIIEKDPGGAGFLFVPSTDVPLKNGVQFGWLMLVDATVSEIEVVEEFSLPKKNQTWNVDPDQTKISDDGLTATTRDTHFFWDFLWRVWTIEDGDPDGRHAFKIALGGQPAADLSFDVRKPAR
jgi:hypothetical protein